MSEKKPQFEEIPVLRGMTMIQPLWDLIAAHGMVLAGGFARWMCSPNESPATANDIDIFAANRAKWSEFLKVLEHLGFTESFESDFALTMSYARHKGHAEYDPRLAVIPKVQLIKVNNFGPRQTWGKPHEVISGFDFTVIRIAILNETTALADPRFYRDETRRVMYLGAPQHPVVALHRLQKYARKGYYAPPFTVAQIFEEWENADATWRGDTLHRYSDPAYDDTSFRVQFDEDELGIVVDDWRSTPEPEATGD